MESLDFEEYLKNKKIDPQKFSLGDQRTFNDFKMLFDQVHPNSFTAQKLFLINKIRRQFPLEIAEKTQTTSVKKKAKPVIRRK